MPPIIGWTKEKPVLDTYRFNPYLTARDGRLYYADLDLTQLVRGDKLDQGLGQQLPSPLEVVYLPTIRHKIATMQQIFAEVRAEVGYEGDFHYAYASKANTAEEVVRATLQAGAHYEMSSNVDVSIAQLMHERGHLPPERMVIANGFKVAGMSYTRQLISLKESHPLTIPVIEDLQELPPLLAADTSFEVGLRQKSYGHHLSQAEMEAANSRFGLKLADLWEAAILIKNAPNLRLKLYHAMTGSQITDEHKFVTGLKPTIEIYARLRQEHPHLSIFDFGGGVPVGLTLDFTFDYHLFARLLLTTVQTVCQDYGVPVPDIMGEFGRYTTAEHGFHLFKVLTVKENNAAYPWYILDGSIMTSFPDSWALGEHFIVLPLNHLDQPFQRVQLGGITCDSDDIYPPRNSQASLYLPVETKELYLGFFSIGAYQEMLGGVRGSKHCVLPEATELVVDQTDTGEFQFHLIPGQTTQDVLNNLGYL